MNPNKEVFKYTMNGRSQCTLTLYEYLIVEVVKSLSRKKTVYSTTEAATNAVAIVDKIFELTKHKC